MRESHTRFRVLASFVFLLVLTTSAQAQATRTWVAGTGNDVNPCTHAAPCRTFAVAITQTAAGGEINVKNAGEFGAVGANATVSQNDSLVLGSGVKVGIGSSSPAEKLHVVGNVFIGGNPVAGANGLILKSPNGATCAKLTIDNAGALVTAVVVCP